MVLACEEKAWGVYGICSLQLKLGAKSGRKRAVTLVTSAWIEVIWPFLVCVKNKLHVKRIASKSWSRSQQAHTFLFNALPKLVPCLVYNNTFHTGRPVFLKGAMSAAATRY